MIQSWTVIQNWTMTLKQWTWQYWAGGIPLLTFHVVLKLLTVLLNLAMCSVGHVYIIPHTCSHYTLHNTHTQHTHTHSSPHMSTLKAHMFPLNHTYPHYTTHAPTWPHMSTSKHTCPQYITGVYNSPQMSTLKNMSRLNHTCPHFTTHVSNRHLRTHVYTI